jgi:hypothetical protein
MAYPGWCKRHWKLPDGRAMLGIEGVHASGLRNVRADRVGKPARSLWWIGGADQGRRSMALLHMTQERGVSSIDVLRVVLLVAALIALMVVLTVVFGVHRSGPSYEIVPDPARFLPFG